MSQLVQICGFFAIVFACSFGISWLLVAVRSRSRLLCPEANTIVQIKSGASMYRSRFVGKSELGWVLTAPLSRDAYVPVRVGEKLVVRAPSEKGLLLFEAEVVLRDSETHELTLQQPTHVSTVERRRHKRIKESGIEASAEGKRAAVVDISQSGARLVTDADIPVGERMRLTLSASTAPFAWVLHNTPAKGFYNYTRELRVCFEELISVDDLPKQAAGSA